MLPTTGINIPVSFFFKQTVLTFPRVMPYLLPEVKTVMSSKQALLYATYLQPIAVTCVRVRSEKLISLADHKLNLIYG